MVKRNLNKITSALLLTTSILALAVGYLGGVWLHPSGSCTGLDGWGTGVKNSTTELGTIMNGATIEPTTCYDRLTIDLGSDTVRYHVAYATSVPAQGSGTSLTLTSPKKLQIDVSAASYDGDSGATLYNATVNNTLPGVSFTGTSSIKEAKWGGSFEGQSTIGLGISAEKPFRVFTNGSLLMVDVAR